MPGDNWRKTLGASLSIAELWWALPGQVEKSSDLLCFVYLLSRALIL
jgi:hypothetical protein